MALTEKTLEFNEIPCTCYDSNNNTYYYAKDQSGREWLFCNYRITIKPETDNSRYKISISANLTVKYWDMSWNGESYARLKCEGYNEGKLISSQEQTLEVLFPLYGNSGVDSEWKGPWDFYFPTSYIDTIKINADIDLTRTEGTYGGRGPSYVNRPGVNFQHFYLNNVETEVASIPLIVKPTLGKIVNTNKYNHPVNKLQDYISADENSISIKWETVGGNEPDWCKYRIDSGIWNDTSQKYSQFITGLDPGTSYKIEVYGHNGGGDSNTISITIRTRYHPPQLSLKLNSVDLETLTFDWTSDKDLKETYYKIDDGEFVKLNQTGKSGTFTTKWFDPKTKHTIYFYGISTDTLDALTGDTVNASGTTFDRARLIGVDQLIFGLPITFTISSESEKNMKLSIWSVGKTRETSKFIYDGIVKTNASFDYKWEPTQEQLDDIYKNFTDTNDVQIMFLLTTHGDNKDWDDTTMDKILQLTGIAKTSHIGISNLPRRAQCFIGVDGKPRRAVAWVGVDNTPRRCI